MERNETIYEVALKAGQDAGIKATNLDEAFTSSALPESGTIIDWDIKEYMGKPYFVLYTTGGGEVSLSHLCANAHKGDKETAKFAKSEKPENKGKDSFGKYFLTETVSVNPELAKNHADVIARLIGHDFVAKKSEFWILPLEQAVNKTTKQPIPGKYVFCGTPAEAEAKLKAKGYYILSGLTKNENPPKYTGTLHRTV